MKYIIGFILFTVIVVFIITIMQQIIKNNTSSSLFPKRENKAAESIKTVAWIPYWDQQRAFESFTQHTDSIDFVSVFWYRIDPNGTIKKYDSAVEDTAIIDHARANNVKVLAIIANMADFHEEGDWDSNRVQKVIESKESRKKHIEDIVRLVEEKNFDGVDIDYEMLKEKQRENFSLFIKELANELHKKGKVLGVAIHPKTSENNPREDNGSKAQDLQELAKYADHLYFMTYLEHGTFSSPGPLGSYSWMEEVLRYAVDTLQVPKERVFMGVGLMGVSWRIDPSQSFRFHGEREDIPFEEVFSIAQAHGISPAWDPSSQSPKFEYTDETGKYIVWFENNDSVAARINLAKNLGLGGVGLWRLGGEDQAIWGNFPIRE